MKITSSSLSSTLYSGGLGQQLLGAIKLGLTKLKEVGKTKRDAGEDLAHVAEGAYALGPGELPPHLAILQELLKVPAFNAILNLAGIKVAPAKSAA
jgi:hypothetical protein